MKLEQASLTFIGGGNMASSIIGGLLAAGITAQQITVSDPSEESLQRVRQLGDVNTTQDNSAAVASADVVIMAVKPQVMRDIAEALAPSLAAKRPMVISIAAGIRSASLSQWLGGQCPVVRCMPNTPALLAAGATALYADDQVSAEQRSLAEAILQAVGLSVWVEEEADLDVVTAVSGSGPAYFFLLMEAMQAEAEAMGMNPQTASALIAQTALGAARMAKESGSQPAELRRQVTSPKGTTEAAINQFTSDEFISVVGRALRAARDRSISLSAELEQA